MKKISRAVPQTERQSKWRKLILKILVVVFFTLLPTNLATAQFNARITQIDSGAFPKIRVYISITDSNGNPIPDNLQVQLTLLENGKPVSQNVYATGWTVSSVLVLDVSGSMNTSDKIEKAKQAAVSYLNIAPSNYRIAAVKFSDTANPIGGFELTRDALRNEINNLSAGGSTALQDGIGLGLQLLQNRGDRKAIIVLTDGRENNSRLAGSAGYKELLRRAKNDKCTISTIGLGTDVDVKYLKGYEISGGWYLFSPGPNELQAIFTQAVKLLEKETVVEYISATKDADGSINSLSINLQVGDQVSRDARDYVSPGVIPHVRGNHIPYIVIILGLLLAPGTFSQARYLFSVRRFRINHLLLIQRGSAHLGKRDPNIGPGEKGFIEGDLVIICPKSKTLHHVSSWRNNRCCCMQIARASCRASV